MNVRLLVIAAACAALATACSTEYGQTRGTFQFKVAGKTLDDAISDAGKPARTIEISASERVLVYEKRTFNTENMNAKDAEVRVTFKKNAEGKFVFADIGFTPEPG